MRETGLDGWGYGEENWELNVVLVLLYLKMGFTRRYVYLVALCRRILGKRPTVFNT